MTWLPITPQKTAFKTCCNIFVRIIEEPGQFSSIALGYGLDNRGFDSRQGLGVLLIAASRPALRPTQSPIQWVPGAPYLGVKRPGREADHLTPSSAEVKNEWSYTSTPPIRLYGVVLSLKIKGTNLPLSLSSDHMCELLGLVIPSLMKATWPVSDLNS
jgi:hypothetical protein